MIDGRITYCGSQNCADPEFLIKAKYAPWVDAVLRLEGPIARQNQHLFAGLVDELREGEYRRFVEVADGLARRLDFPELIATGPTVRYSAMPEVFEP